MTNKILILFAFIAVTAVNTINAQVPSNAEDVSPLLIGERVPEATLIDPDGNKLTLKSVIKEKPTVLVFYRGGWCPYCNAQLSGLSESESKILELGYQIIAISPDNYKNLKPTMQEDNVAYSLYSDPEAKLIQDIGIGFETPSMAKMYIKKKTKMDATDILPVPTVMVLNTSGEILFEYINPNYKVRLSESLLLSALKALKDDM
ncbi:peroxiredoxin-like family protein [Corallibacter vietnamensis]|uniref:thioredoxin-dependent peroxiredoxin n=1 Tax=Corallibacter vietnamensis TaxID=904130 RepID=A0ABP7GXW8_9FLAO